MTFEVHFFVIKANGVPNMDRQIRKVEADSKDSALSVCRKEHPQRKIKIVECKQLELKESETI